MSSTLTGLTRSVPRAPLRLLALELPEDDDDEGEGEVPEPSDPVVDSEEEEEEAGDTHRSFSGSLIISASAGETMTGVSNPTT
jgi:hypothetical protein